MKPYMGKIKQAYRVYWKEPTSEHLGYFYRCRFVDPPYFAGESGQTSMVVSEKGDEVETLNSRYTILREIENYNPISI